MHKVRKNTAAQVGGSVQATHQEEKNMTAFKGLVMALVTTLVFSAFAWDDPGITTRPQASHDTVTEQQELTDIKREYRAFLAAQQQEDTVLTEAEELWQVKQEYQAFLAAQQREDTVLTEAEAP